MKNQEQPAKASKPATKPTTGTVPIKRNKLGLRKMAVEPEEKKPSIEEQALEAMSKILLGEKIPLDIGDAQTGELLIPANRKITKALLKRLVKHREHLDIDPSPVRNKVREVLMPYLAANAAPTPESDLPLNVEPDLAGERAIHDEDLAVPASPQPKMKMDQADLAQREREREEHARRIQTQKQERRRKYKQDYIAVRGKAAWASKQRAKRYRYYVNKRATRKRKQVRDVVIILPPYRPYGMV